MVELFDLVCEVAEVTGSCVANFKKGTTFVLGGDGTIDLRRSDQPEKLCYWALSDLMPALLSLHLGHDPKELGLSNETGVACIRCSDPGPPYTPGGSVLFKIRKSDKSVFWP